MVLLLKRRNKRKVENRDREVAPTRRGFEGEIETTRKPNASAIFLTWVCKYFVKISNRCRPAGETKNGGFWSIHGLSIEPGAVTNRAYWSGDQSCPFFKLILIVGTCITECQKLYTPLDINSPLCHTKQIYSVSISGSCQ